MSDEPQDLPTHDEAINTTDDLINQIGITVNFCFKLTMDKEPEYIKAEVVMPMAPKSMEEYVTEHQSIRSIVSEQTGIPIKFIEPLSLLDYMKLAEDGGEAEEAEVELTRPAITLIAIIGGINTASAFGRKWFEVRLKFSDGSVSHVSLTMADLKEKGAPVTKLSELRKLKDWIMGEGRHYFESAVNGK